MLALLQLALREFPLVLLGFPRRRGTRTKACRDCVFSTCLWFPLLLPNPMPSPPAAQAGKTGSDRRVEREEPRCTMDPLPPP